MKLSMKWLGRYVDLKDISAQELAETLTLAGLEVESVQALAFGTNLIIGEVLTCVKHPSSDHLSLTEVNIGDKILQIVCGAPNVAKGQKVIVAQVGSVLPHLIIKETMIKEIASQGMICSLNEIGIDPKILSQAQLDGIEVLANDTPIGGEALSQLGLDDVILDVKPTPNRSDFNAYWSVAYEVGALLKRPVSLPHIKDYHQQGSATQLKVGSETPYCPLFLGKKIGSIEVKASPPWIKQALEAIGMHSINNVVDISNFVMLETGQPLHFYDAAKLKHEEIIVKTGLKGHLTTLDDKQIEFNPHDLIITSHDQAIGLAGIMGGSDSKIDETTKAIIIEAAQFNPSHIRHSARRVNLSTEASLRFQKGLDPQSAYKALDRSVELLVQYASATKLETTVHYGALQEALKKVSVTHEHIESLLGAKIELEQCMEVFTRLRFDPVMDQKHIVCTIPSYRLDIDYAEDLIEEVGRVIGYESLVLKDTYQQRTRGAYTLKQRTRHRIKQVLIGQGMHEIVSYTLVSEAKSQEGVLPLSHPAVLLSPISEDKKVVRTSLLPSMLEVLAYNQAHKLKNFQLFEITNLNNLTQQEERLGIIQSGSLNLSSWQKQTLEFDFYTLKGSVSQLLMELGFADSRIRFEKSAQHAYFHPLRSAKLFVDQQLIGLMGEIHPTIAKQLGISTVMLGEISLEKLYALKISKVKFAASSKMPVVERDFAFVLDQDIEVYELEKVIKRAAKDRIVFVEVFDVYQGEHLAQGKKSLALRVGLQAIDHTLSDDEIKLLEKRIIEDAIKHCHASLR